MADKPPQQRRWQLGKEPKSAPPPPPAPKPAPKPKSPNPRMPPARLPSAYDHVAEDEESMPPRRRPSPAAAPPEMPNLKLPRTPREALGHPITLVVVGIVACIAIFVTVFGPRGGGRLGAPRAVELTTQETVTAFLGGSDVRLPGSDLRLPAVEPEQVRDARVLLAAGQMLQVVADWRVAHTEGRAAPPQTVQFLPPAIYEAPVPREEDGRDSFPATVLREEATANAMLATQEALRRSIGTSIDVPTIRAAATLLQLEALALVEAAGDEAVMRRLPRAAGATDRLGTARDTSDPAQVPAVISALFPQDFAGIVISVRNRHMAMLHPIGGTSAAP